MSAVIRKTKTRSQEGSAKASRACRPAALVPSAGISGEVPFRAGDAVVVWPGGLIEEQAPQ